MSLTRNYAGGTGDYSASSSEIRVSYAVAGTDGAAVTGQLSTNYLLTPAQTDALCDALAKACGGLTWMVEANIVVVENGVRSWTVVDEPDSEG
jgi:hypothetical protein